ncbi:hypothetical protein CH063_15933 [Colletotrichum higginsianum]|uniref:Uncharacterized protein n=1 Tax=Colletotrichum higginsianum (strain IMI 349063) TaxID=759273 RepID=H1W546_COLHI|nr:hypothetical protein CH063_15933 [Colletotrichum higginsianum]
MACQTIRRKINHHVVQLTPQRWCPLTGYILMRSRREGTFRLRVTLANCGFSWEGTHPPIQPFFLPHLFFALEGVNGPGGLSPLCAPTTMLVRVAENRVGIAFGVFCPRTSCLASCWMDP